MKLYSLKQALVIIIFLCVILITNFLLGTERILEAYAHSFHGGECEMAFPPVTDICSKSYGFDSYYLIYSVFVVAFFFGFLNVVRNMHLLKSIFSVIASSVLFVAIVEFVIWILHVPVLFTSFTEGTQYLKYIFLSGMVVRDGNGIILILFLIILVSLFGMIGNIVGYPILFFRNKRKKS